MAKVTMYQIETREFDGRWIPMGRPFESKTEAELAAAEWLPDTTTRIDTIVVEVS